jgi:diguanylate cyclase (GGDEF)-like protein/PAS domain S-box-containing protein
MGQSTSELVQGLRTDSGSFPRLERPTGRAVSPLLQLVQLGRNADARQPESLVDGLISRGVLRQLLKSLQLRSAECFRHSQRVAQLAVSLAEHLGWEGRRLRALEIAGLLHDIGKIGVPDHILFKPGKLSPDELELMALHYNIACDVLQTCRVEREVLEIVSHAQASHVGEGQAGGGPELALGGRILAVCDAYESLSSDQPYRTGRPHEDCLAILNRASGVQFDGNVVNALSRMVRMHGLPESTAVPELPTSDDSTAATLTSIFSELYLLESLYDGFFLADADLRVICWNRGAESLLGRSSDDILCRNWTTRLLDYRDLEGQPLDETAAPLHRALAQGKSVVSELLLTRRDGRALRLETQTCPLLNKDGEFHGVVEIFRDLTRSGGRRPQEFRELKLAATRDALTSVANRGELESQLTHLVGEFSRNPLDPFSVIFVDADHFKSVNDRFGHAVGDQVLIEIARLLQEETYSGEVVGRYGGEEFVVLCPATDLAQAVRRAERLRTAIRSTKIPGQDQLTVTASFGVAQIEPGDSVESVLRRADKALYTAKEQGRDRTCSKTTRQMMEKEADLGTAPEAQDPFLYSNWFAAVVAADMVVYKLGGFVSDHAAQLVEVTKQHVLLRQGRQPLFGGWGKTPDLQPIEIEVVFGTPIAGADSRGRSQPKVNIGIKVKPIGRCRNPEQFQQRAADAARELKHYFAAG